jgi:hypothetical protein
MGKSDEYRRYAEECLMLANVLHSPEARSVLLQMARVWFRLADQREGSSAATPGGESPHL